MLSHISVLLREAIQVLAPERGGLYLDCTFGAGGHSRAILDAHSDNQVVALDCDPDAEERAEQFSKEYPKRFTFYTNNFAQVSQIPESSFTGILFDLGVSSFQLDDAERGFSFRKEAPVDMRMDNASGQSAFQFLESASREDLVKAVRDYGEETKWRKVVDAILDKRGSGVLATTTDFAELLEQVIGRAPYGKRARIHPATKVFQGIRMAVNRELESIEQALPAAFEKLKPGGVLAVISFHSLEDRMVKRYFKRVLGRPEHRFDSRTQDQRECLAKAITRKPIAPTEEEIEHNSRSRSAKLRAVEKL